MKNKNILVFGHRGAMGHLPENTLPSIRKALDLGVDGIEIDVIKIRSGEIVVFHDSDLDRLTNSSGAVESLVLEDLDHIKVGAKYKIPLLEDVLEIVKGKVILNIELKGAGTAVRVYEILQKQGIETSKGDCEIIISSFNWDELKKYREMDQGMPIGVLVEEDAESAITVAKELRAYSIHPYYKLLDKGMVNRIHEEGFKLIIWTVNAPEDIQYMADLEVDGIISDFPDRII